MSSRSVAYTGVYSCGFEVKRFLSLTSASKCIDGVKFVPPMAMLKSRVVTLGASRPLVVAGILERLASLGTPVYGLLPVGGRIVPLLY